jgi:hypothetical protein
MGSGQSKKVVSKRAAAAATKKALGIVAGSNQPIIYPGFKYISPETMRIAMALAEACDWTKHKQVQRKEDVLRVCTPVNDSRTHYDTVLVNDMMQGFNLSQTDAIDI